MQNTEILPFKQKKTESLYMFKSLYNYISAQYGKPAAESHKAVLNQIQQEREEILNLQDGSEGGRLHLIKYAQEVEFLDKHFPINFPSGSKKLNYNFSWYDSYDSTKLSQGNTFYEIAGCLYNAAVIDTQIGAVQNRSTDEGVTLSVKKFKSAASIFDFIKTKLSVKMPEKITSDISSDALECVISICNAHTQQCVVEKSILNNMSLLVIGKLAQGASQLFENSLNLINNSVQLKKLFPKKMINYINFKKLYFEAVSDYYLAQNCHKELAIGNELSYLNRAIARVKEAKDLYYIPSSLVETSKSFLKILLNQHDESDKENDQVYHEKIPGFNTLPLTEKKHLFAFKPMENLNELSQGLNDPFAKLFPIQVIEAKTRYNEKIQTLFINTFRKAREHRESVRSKLSDWNLPAAILAIDQKVVGFSADIHEKIFQINSKGGIERVSDLQKTLSEVAQQTIKLLQKGTEILNIEEVEDTKCRQQYGIKWTRVPSQTFTISLRKPITDYSNKLQMAQKSDTIIEKKISDNFQRFKKFSLTKQELDSSLPNASQEIKSNQYCNELKKFLNELENYLTKEEEVEISIKNEHQALDVNGFLLENQDKIDAAIQKQIQKFEEKLKILEELSSKEDLLMGNVFSSNNNFIKSKQTNNINNQREMIIQDTCGAIDKYKEVISNLQEGIQFYLTMQDLVQKLIHKIKDFIFSRNTEKLDLIQNIQIQILDDNQNQNPYVLSNPQNNFNNQPNPFNNNNNLSNQFQNLNLQNNQLQNNQYQNNQFQNNQFQNTNTQQYKNPKNQYYNPPPPNSNKNFPNAPY